MKQFIRIVLGVAVVSVGAGQLPAAIVYTITDLGTLGGSYSDAYGVNDLGQVVGESETGSGEFHAFLYDGSAMQDLVPLGGSASIAYGINNSGHVVGGSDTAAGDYHAFRYRDGVMHDMMPEGLTSTAFSINDLGHVVCEAEMMSGVFHATMDVDGAMSSLGTLGGDFSAAFGINDAGQVVGEAETATWDYRAFLHSSGSMRDLGTLGGRDSRANAINAPGQVAGEADTAGGDSHAFLYTGGTMQDLGTLGGRDSAAFAVNDAGQIVGRSATDNGSDHAFLFDPSVGTIMDLNDAIPAGSPWTLSAARGINGSGQIAASGYFGSETHALLLTPTTLYSLVWVGQGNGDWGVPDHWIGDAPDGVPDATTQTTVRANTVSVTAAGDAYSLLITDGGGTVMVDDGVDLKVVDVVNVAQGGTLDVHGTLQTDSASVTGTLKLGVGGAINVAGNLATQNGSKCVLQLNRSGNGLISVGGEVDLDSSNTLALKVVGSLGDLNQREWGVKTRTIIAAGSLSGKFTNVPSGSLGYGVFFDDVIYHDDSAELRLLQAAPGDTDGDRLVGGSDIEAILAANKFGKSEAELRNEGTWPAIWPDGDFNADHLVGGSDIQAILAANLFGQPDPYAAADNHQPADASLKLLLAPDGLLIDTGDATINGYVLTSETGVFRGKPAENLGLFQEDTDHQISGNSGFALTGAHWLGDVIADESDGVDLMEDLTFSYTIVGVSGTYLARIVVVPEPATVMSLSFGAIAMLLLLAGRRRRSNRRP